MHKCFRTEQRQIKEKVWKWFNSQQNTTEMLGDWVCVEKKSSYWKDWNGKGEKELNWVIKLLKDQKRRTEEKFIRDGWNCGVGFKPTWDYYPFHAEETDIFLALCWVRHIYKNEGVKK